MIEIRVLACMFLAVALSTSAQQDSNVDVLSKEANAAYEAKNWESAVKLYEELSKEMTTPPPRVWLRLGAALRSLGRYEEALAAFEKAGQSGAGLFGEYGKAAVYVALHQPEKAFAALDKAVQQGYADPDALTSDPDLSVLRNDPRFARIIEQAKKNQRPCAYTPENREFDFLARRMECKHNSGGSPFRKQQNRTHLGGLCGSGKLEEPQQSLRGQKL